MKVMKTAMSGLLLLEPKVFGDQRGFFFESYNENTAKSLGLSYSFVQDNQSLSVEAGVIRGLHYQLNPYAQTKLIRATSGAIYDVVVDIRKGSPSFGQWWSFILSASNHRQLLVPAGFAHGFCTLVPNTEVQYKVDAYYNPQYDRGIVWNDPAIGIDWPTSNPVLSDKDSKHPALAEAEINYLFES